MSLNFLVKSSFLVGKSYGCNTGSLANTVFSNIISNILPLQKKKYSGNSLLAQSRNKILIIFLEQTSRSGISGEKSWHLFNILPPLIWVLLTSNHYRKNSTGFCTCNMEFSSVYQTYWTNKSFDWRYHINEFYPHKSLLFK